MRRPRHAGTLAHLERAGWVLRSAARVAAIVARGGISALTVSVVWPGPRAVGSLWIRHPESRVDRDRIGPPMFGADDDGPPA